MAFLKGIRFCRNYIEDDVVKKGITKSNLSHLFLSLFFGIWFLLFVALREAKGMEEQFYQSPIYLTVQLLLFWAYCFVMTWHGCVVNSYLYSGTKNMPLHEVAKVVTEKYSKRQKGIIRRVLVALLWSIVMMIPMAILLFFLLDIKRWL